MNKIKCMRIFSGVILSMLEVFWSGLDFMGTVQEAENSIFFPTATWEKVKQLAGKYVNM